MNNRGNSSSITTIPSQTGPSPEDQKTLLVADFLRESGLHWNRVIEPALAEMWLQRVMKFTPRVIKAGFDDFMESEAFFPVPGTVFPYIRFVKGNPDKPRVGVLEPAEPAE